MGHWLHDKDLIATEMDFDFIALLYRHRQRGSFENENETRKRRNRKRLANFQFHLRLFDPNFNDRRDDNKTKKVEQFVYVCLRVCDQQVENHSLE